MDHNHHLIQTLLQYEQFESQWLLSRTERSATALGWIGNLAQDFVYRGGMARSDQAGDFPAVVHEDQRRPERHAEGATKRAPFAIFDLNMAYGRVVGESRGNKGLSSTAITAPGRAKLYDSGTVKRINLCSQRLSSGINVVHASIIICSGENAPAPTPPVSSRGAPSVTSRLNLQVKRNYALCTTVTDCCSTRKLPTEACIDLQSADSTPEVTEPTADLLRLAFPCIRKA
jgi:hypothetical protein